MTKKYVSNEVLESLAELYKMNNWTWVDLENPSQDIQPTVEDLREALEGLYSDVKEDKGCESVRTGRLCVARESDESGLEYIQFYLELGNDIDSKLEELGNLKLFPGLAKAFKGFST